MNERTSEQGLAANRLQLGDFVLDLLAGELLTADGRLAGLRRQALEVLLLLGTRAGQVVSKDELMQRVWPGLVVGDGSLTQAIADIRRVLGDQEHQLVRNVARRGYLLEAQPVVQASTAVEAMLPAGTGSGPPVNASAAAAGAARPAADAYHRRVWAAALAALAVMLVMGGAILLPRDAPTPQRSIAVLPFESAADAAEAWFVDALTADLTTELGRSSAFFVIGHGSLRGYRGRIADPREVAREFGVRHIVTGRVRRDGERVQLDVTMVDGHSGQQLWTQRRQIGRGELETSIADMAGGLARSLQIELTARAVRARRPMSTAESQADDLAMQGMALFTRRLDASDLEQAQALFEQALALNPNSVRALAGTSVVAGMSAIYGLAADRAAAVQQAEQALVRLEALDPASPMTLRARGTVLNLRAEWPALLGVGDELVAQFPNEAPAHATRCSALLRLGSFDDSIAACERAIRISPGDSRVPVLRAHIGFNLVLAGRPTDAVPHLRAMVQAQPRFVPFYSLLLAVALADSGQRDEARAIVQRFIADYPAFRAERINANWRASDARFVAGRERIVAAVRELGLP